MDLRDCQIEIAVPSRAELGEGAFWDANHQRLFWVDIEHCLLNIYDPESGENTEIKTGSRIGTVVPIDRNRVVIALQEGIHILDLTNGQKDFKLNPLDSEKLRFNDGKCDAKGRFWAGSIHLEGQENRAAFYRIDSDFSCQKIFDRVTNSNGLIWNSSNTKFFYIDTATQKVKVFDFDLNSGTLSNGRKLVEIDKEEGSPDGMTIDAEDNLWIALYGGAAVVCHNSEDGRRLAKLELPAPNITSCAFGGEKLNELYVTSARQGMQPADLEKFPRSGSVFKVNVPVKGVVGNYFKPVR